LNVAILSDIHANFDALSAVAAELARRRPDRIYHLGDLAGYNAQPEECVRWTMANAAAGVSGNHDAVACGRAAGRNFHAAARKAALWSRDRISPECRDYLSGRGFREHAKEAVGQALPDTVRCENHTRNEG